MKNILLKYLLMWVVICGFTKCSEKKEQIQAIKPLHPYRGTPADYNVNEDKSRSFVIKYFFVENFSSENTAAQGIEQLVQKYCINDSDFVRFGNYQIWLYRKTSEINENFREDLNGMVSYKSLSDYDQDIIFKFIWTDQQFSGCEIYDIGKRIRIKRNINGSVFKDTTSSVSSEGDDIIMERID